MRTGYFRIVVATFGASGSTNWIGAPPISTVLVTDMLPTIFIYRKNLLRHPRAIKHQGSGYRKIRARAGGADRRDSHDRRPPSCRGAASASPAKPRRT